MVCVPCFILPVLLYIWHRFFQPILLRYWNPWEKKDSEGNIIKAGPEFPFQCKGNTCSYVPKNDNSINQTDKALILNDDVEDKGAAADIVETKKDN